MSMNDDNYFQALKNIKGQIKSVQQKAVSGLNRKQIILYWNIVDEFFTGLEHVIKHELG